MRLDQNLTAGGIKGFKAYNVGRRGPPWAINRHEAGYFRISQTARLSGVDNAHRHRHRVGLFARVLHALMAPLNQRTIARPDQQARMERRVV